MSSMLLLSALLSILTFTNGMQIGTIPYWDKVSDYATLPSSGIAVINPSDGIIGASLSDISQFRQIINSIKSKTPSVILLGYVPTGYGDRKKQPYATIQKQVQAYFASFPQLDGIFYDETDGQCSQTGVDLPQFRNFVRSAKPNGVIAYNPGWVGENQCYLNLAQKGEIVMDFESPLASYKSVSSKNDLSKAKTIAKNRGVKTWHVVYNTQKNDLQATVNMAKGFDADYVYVCENNSYNKPPSYWSTEKQLVK